MVPRLCWVLYPLLDTKPLLMVLGVHGFFQGTNFNGPIPSDNIFTPDFYGHIEDLRLARYSEPDIQKALGVSALPPTSWVNYI